MYGRLFSKLEVYVQLLKLLYTICLSMSTFNLQKNKKYQHIFCVIMNKVCTEIRNLVRMQIAICWKEQNAVESYKISDLSCDRTTLFKKQYTLVFVLGQDKRSVYHG